MNPPTLPIPHSGANRVKQLDVNKLLQTSMDGPSVNHKFLEKVSKEGKGEEQHQLINIGSCGLHTIHGAFKTGAKNTKWNINQNESLRTLLLSHQVGTAFEARKTIYATCTYQLLECYYKLHTLRYNSSNHNETKILTVKTSMQQM